VWVVRGRSRPPLSPPSSPPKCTWQGYGGGGTRRLHAQAFPMAWPWGSGQDSRPPWLVEAMAGFGVWNTRGVLVGQGKKAVARLRPLNSRSPSPDRRASHRWGETRGSSHDLDWDRSRSRKGHSPRSGREGRPAWDPVREWGNPMGDARRSTSPPWRRPMSPMSRKYGPRSPSPAPRRRRADCYRSASPVASGRAECGGSHRRRSRSRSPLRRGSGRSSTSSGRNPSSLPSRKSREAPGASRFKPQERSPSPSGSLTSPEVKACAGGKRDARRTNSPSPARLVAEPGLRDKDWKTSLGKETAPTWQGDPPNAPHSNSQPLQPSPPRVSSRGPTRSPPQKRSTSPYSSRGGRRTRSPSVRRSPPRSPSLRRRFSGSPPWPLEVRACSSKSGSHSSRASSPSRSVGLSLSPPRDRYWSASSGTSVSSSGASSSSAASSLQASPAASPSGTSSLPFSLDGRSSARSRSRSPCPGQCLSPHPCVVRAPAPSGPHSCAPMQDASLADGPFLSKRVAPPCLFPVKAGHRGTKGVPPPAPQICTEKRIPEESPQPGSKSSSPEVCTQKMTPDERHREPKGEASLSPEVCRQEGPPKAEAIRKGVPSPSPDPCIHMGFSEVYTHRVRLSSEKSSATRELPGSAAGTPAPGQQSAMASVAVVDGRTGD
jgi:hypothetical protein